MRLAATSSTALLIIATATTGCVGKFDLVGGPRNQTVSIERAEDLLPYVQGSAEARERVEELDSDEGTAKAMTYTSYGFLGASLALGAGAIAQSGPGNSDTTIGMASAGIGTAAASLAFSIASMVFTPTHNDYKEVLETYNRDFPQHPYRSSDLDVRPAARQAAALGAPLRQP